MVEGYNTVSMVVVSLVPEDGVNLSSISVFVNTWDPPKMELFRGFSVFVFTLCRPCWLLASWASFLVDNCLIRSCKHSGLQCGHRQG